jgi:DNA polymerase III subunit epsilon
VTRGLAPGPRGSSVCGPPPGVQASPWRDVEFCALDFETTGLDLRRDDIVSYGAVIVSGGRLRASTAAYGLVRPRRRISPRSIAVHALRPADVAGAPSLRAGVDELLGLLAGRVLLAHAAWIEQAFLGRALRGRRVHLAGPVVDTARLAVAAGVTAADPSRAVSLEWLARQLGLPGHTPHHALGDALTTAEVFLALAARLDAITPQTVGSLAAATSAR